MTLQNEHVGMQVERFGDKRKFMYKIDENGICIVKAGTEIEPCDEKIKIYDEFENAISPMGKYYITCDTIEPYHIILDM